jgi:hypothetical protein
MPDILEFALSLPFHFGACCAVLGLTIIGFSTASPATRRALPFGISLFAASTAACLAAAAVKAWVGSGLETDDYDVTVWNKFRVLIAFYLVWLIALPISFLIAITPLKHGPRRDFNRASSAARHAHSQTIRKPTSFDE